MARGGLDVTVLEKNPRAGGRCDRIWQDGHRFDTGPTLFVLPGLYASELSALGVSMRDELELLRVDPTYRVVFEDGSRLELTDDTARMREQLETIEPGSFQGLCDYLEEARRHYQDSLEQLIRRDFRRTRDVLAVRDLRTALRLKLFVPHYRHTRRYFRSPRLRAAFTFQDFYMGMSPARAAATFSLIPFSELEHGVWYPRGGMYSVVELLERRAREVGVRFRFDEPVERIELEGGRATGVRLRSGRHVRADAVVANADLPYVYGCLLPNGRGSRRMLRRRLSCSAVSLFWGVDRALPELTPHTVFLRDDYLRAFADIGREAALAARSNIYVHAPARVDPAAAPDGRETLVSIVPMGHLGASGRIDQRALRERARAQVLDRLRLLGLGDLQQRVRFELSFAPPTWSARYNLHRGAAHGLAHHVTQLGALRPHNRHPRIGNLYFAGASTHPGSGVPTALVSGRLAAERVLEERGARRGRRSTTSGGPYGTRGDQNTTVASFEQVAVPASQTR